MQEKTKDKIKAVKQFCLIEIQVLAEREMRLRKELQNCQLQKEYLNDLIATLEEK